MSVRFFIQRYYCELLSAFDALRYRFATAFRPRKTIDGQRELLENRRRATRKILREYPYWQLGHARLGMTEIELSRMSNLPLAPRSRATVRSSIDAIRCLAPVYGNAGRASVEAELLEACVEFDDRNFQQAYAKAQKILEPVRFAQLTEAGSALVLQIAGRCVSVLEGDEPAKKFYDRIRKVRKVSGTHA